MHRIHAHTHTHTRTHTTFMPGKKSFYVILLSNWQSTKSPRNERRESSKRNYYIISPRVIIKPIIINTVFHDH